MGKMIKQYTLRNAEYINLIVNQTLKHTINLLHNQCFQDSFHYLPENVPDRIRKNVQYYKSIK